MRAARLFQSSLLFFFLCIKLLGSARTHIDTYSLHNTLHKKLYILEVKADSEFTETPELRAENAWLIGVNSTDRPVEPERTLLLFY